MGPMSATRADADLRLALCSVGELYGGVERQLLDLCEYARRRTGRDPLLVLFHDRELARRARERGLAPVVLRGRGRYDPAFVGRLRSALAAAGAEVVHAHGYKAAVACGLARRGAGWGLVKTEHGRIEPARGRPLTWLKARLNRGLENLATRRADVVCYVTEDMRRHCDGVHAGLRRVTIPNGIDPLERADFARPPELAADRLNLGVVGRVSPVKGIATALRALADPAAPRRAVLHVVGSGPLEDELRAQAAAAGLAERVLFHGFRRDAGGWLAHLDALLMPSLHEGLPYVLLEAMALGTPVFASRVGGLAEVIEDGRSGALFPAGDAAALAALVARLAAAPDWGAALGAAARARQRERYTLAAMGEAYWREYLAVRRPAP